MRICNNVEMLEMGTENGFCPTLLWDESHTILVDAGLPMQFDLLRAAMAGTGKKITDITEVIFTHQDIDHIGCVKEILAEAPHAKVLTHAMEAPYLDGRKTPIKLEALEAAGDHIPDEQRAVRDNLRAGFASRRFAVDQLVGDGEVLPFCGGITVLHTPGHTPGHICLYHKDGGVLISGDALNVADGMLTGPSADYSLDIDEAVQSVKKLQGLDIQTVICYHGGVFQGDVRTALGQIVS